MPSFNNNLIQPTKIVCIGKNYAAHIEEMGGLKPDDMTVFLKPPTALSDTLHSTLGETLHYETEICLFMNDGRVQGIAVGFDLTKRETQNGLKKQGLPWERAKAFDGAAVISDFVTAPDSLDDLHLTLHVNGELRQQGHVSMMLYPPQIILNELNHFMTLCDQDIIMTGTPAGVGPVEAGSEYKATVYSGDQVLVSHTWVAV